MNHAYNPHISNSHATLTDFPSVWRQDLCSNIFPMLPILRVSASLPDASSQISAVTTRLSCCCLRALAACATRGAQQCDAQTWRSCVFALFSWPDCAPFTHARRCHPTAVNCTIAQLLLRAASTQLITTGGRIILVSVLILCSFINSGSSLHGQREKSAEPNFCYV